MKEFRKILIPVDGSKSSEAAFRKGIDLARIFQSHLTIVHVLSPMPVPIHGVEGKGLLNEYKSTRKNNRIHMEHTFSNFIHIAKEAGIKIETMFVKGNPAYEVVKMSNDYDLVIIGSRTKNTFKHIFSGGTADKISAHSSCSVMIVREKQKEKPTAS